MVLYNLQSKLYNTIDKLYKKVYDVGVRMVKMKKSVYSIVLMDEVVNQIDRLAYQNSVSRSAMINSILAKHCSYKTPYSVISDIYSRVEEIIGLDGFQTVLSQSNSNMNIRSALAFKYNPTIKYNIGVYPKIEDKLGTVKVSLRTSSATLIAHINNFYKLWVQCEVLYLEPILTKPIGCYVENEKYTRELYTPKVSNLTENELARSISEYISMMDYLIKVYFENLSSTKLDVIIESEFVRKLQSRDYLI